MVKYYVAGFKNMRPLYIFADILEIAEGIDWSHVEIIRVENGRWDYATTYGSIFPKSRGIPLWKFQEHYEMKWIMPLSVKVDYDKADAILKGLMNKNYSMVQIFLAAFRILFGFSVMWLNKAKPNLSKFLICTELVGIFMQEACQYRFETSPELLTLNETRDIAAAGLLQD
jgi:hypothetical protein